MASRVAYDDLHLLPHLVAETVCGRPYESEFSAKLTNPDEVRRVEALRQKMTRRQIDAFARKVDERCRSAYEHRADWFLKCVRSKTNAGRDQLYMWVTHWLHSYLKQPARFLAAGGPTKKPQRRGR